MQQGAHQQFAAPATLAATVGLPGRGGPVSRGRTRGGPPRQLMLPTRGPLPAAVGAVLWAAPACAATTPCVASGPMLRRQSRVLYVPPALHSTPEGFDHARPRSAGSD